MQSILCNLQKPRENNHFLVKKNSQTSINPACEWKLKNEQKIENTVHLFTVRSFLPICGKFLASYARAPAIMIGCINSSMNWQRMYPNEPSSVST